MATVSGGGNVTPAKRLIMMAYKLKNEVAYNPETWAEWTMLGVTSADTTGVVLSTAKTVGGSISINTALKPSTKYGLLYEFLENETTSSFYAQFGSNHGGVGFPKKVGYLKDTTTTPAILGENRFKIGRNSMVDGYIKFKDIRMFELPTGSQVEWDFTNLTPDQLNAKYPF